jgi:hypothetical protein
MISLVIEIRTILFFGSNISVSNCNLALNDVLWFPVDLIVELGGDNLKKLIF